MKKKKLIFALGTVIVLAFVLLFIYESSPKAILRNAIELQTKDWRKHPNEVFYEASNRSVDERRKKITGFHNSLSWFLMSHGGVPERYELERTKSVYDQTNYNYLTGDVIRMSEVEVLSWHDDNGGFYGIFTFDSEFGVKGRCIVKGKNNQVSEMVIARRGSDVLEEGYGVLGCNYGHNAFHALSYANAGIDIPESEVGEIHLRELGRQDACLRLDKEGFLSSGPGSAGRFEDLPREMQRVKTVYLWIDREADRALVSRLKKELDALNIEAYRVYRSSRVEDKGSLIVQPF